MQVPLLDLKAQYQQINNEVEPVLLKVAEDQAFILGAEVKKLEDNIAAYVGAKHAIGVSSGTDALLLAMMALNIGPGDGVIVPTFSFFATAGVVSRLNATPIFIDIDPITFNIDPKGIETAYEKYKDDLNIKAVVPVHLFGQSADMDPIMAFANEKGLFVIEDAAQAIGTAFRDGRRVGSIGTVGCFSFFPSKNLGAFGDGGIITTNDEVLARRIELMRVHGAEKRYYHEVIGGNFRLDAMQAAVLNVKLKYLDAWHEGRRANAANYNNLFKDVETVLTPRSVYEADGIHRDIAYPHIYNQYAIRLRNRETVMDKLNENGIGNAVYYPVPFHAQKCFGHLPSASNSFPVADQISAEVLSLPVYPELTDEMQKFVANTIIEAVR
ncbi:DegT/DnrJ/EryC1/StrS family aminotransferase [bacterium]|nr:DegT/DnrJ/EryC1/StrS family aminotransferase [bacterium]